MDFGQAGSGQDGRAGGSDATACLAQFGREVFCPWRPLEVIKKWHAHAFAAAELVPSMTLKSDWVQNPLTPTVMHIMAPRSHNL